MLKLQNISKQFDGKSVLDHINLEIKTGEIVSLLGPSGSGKTTLLHIILGLTGINHGKIIFNDTDLSNVPMKDRDLISFSRITLFSRI
ncbi:ATP-binding cassette domain-containing protein [Peribacillus frigoritolerans]|nr:ATP-binding cassette domain-containing protein [Peribacillus frigoritolerans]